MKKKTSKLEVRVSHDEYKKVCGEAEKYGLTKSDFIRKKILQSNEASFCNKETCKILGDVTTKVSIALIHDNELKSEIMEGLNKLWQEIM